MKNLSIHATRNLQNGEFLNFCNQTNDWYKELDAKDLLLKSQCEKLLAGTAELDEVFHQQNQRKLSPELKSKQKVRLNLWRSLRKILDAIAQKESVNQHSTGGILLENYEFHNRKRKRVSVPQLTEMINALLKSWSKDPELAALVKTHQLSNWVTELTKINVEVNKLYGKRFANKLKPADIRKKRAEMTSLMQELIADTIAHARLSENPEPYLYVLTSIKNMVENYRTMAKIRAADRSLGTEDIDDFDPNPDPGIV